MLSKLIAAYRKLHGVSQRQLARRIGITNFALRRFEQGKVVTDENYVKILMWTILPEEPNQ